MSGKYGLKTYFDLLIRFGGDSQAFFFLSFFIYIYKKKSQFFSVTVTSLTLHNHQSLFFSLFFFSLSVIRGMFHFLYFLGKSLKSKEWDVSVGVYYQQEEVSGQDVATVTSTWFLSTPLVAETRVMWSHKGLLWNQTCTSVSFIPSRNQLSNFSLKKRIPRCNKILSLAI